MRQRCDLFTTLSTSCPDDHRSFSSTREVVNVPQHDRATNSRSAPANTPPSEKTSTGARISPKRARPGEEAAGWPGTLSVRRRSPACMRRAPGSRDRSRGERNAPKRQPSLRPRSSRTPGYDHSDISPAGTYDRTPYVLMLFIVPPKPDPPLRTRAGVV